MKSKWKFIITLFCMCFVLLPSAFADKDSWNMCKKMGMYGKMGGEMDMKDKIFHKIRVILSNAEKLNLNESQIEQLENQTYLIKKSMIEKEADIKTLALEIKKELGKDTINKDTVNALIDQKYEAKKQKTKELVDGYITVNSILTGDQKKALKTMWYEQMKMPMMMMDKEQMSEESSGKEKIKNRKMMDKKR
jgi:Spy/CpxP family protein refolding chaperone